MNGDLISRSALKGWLTRPTGFRTNCEDCTDIDCLDCIIGEAIDNAPAVDAVVLPCKVGDTVWGIRNYKGINHPQQGKVDQMYFTNDMRLHIKIKHICIGEWGKKIFPTREEAEAALKRRGKNERD